MSVNKVILVGNLGKDPEVRFTGGGRAVCKFPLATSETWNDAEGHKQERTEWHNIVVWGKQGENCGQYLSKGRQVYVEGAIRTRQSIFRACYQRLIAKGKKPKVAIVAVMRKLVTSLNAMLRDSRAWNPA